MTGQHTYSTPYGGREIYRDGKPFAVIGKPNDAPPCVEYYNDLSAFGRMAAAAPDMLRELEAKEAWMVDYVPPETPGYAAELSALRAAIAKAKGSEATP